MKIFLSYRRADDLVMGGLAQFFEQLSNAFGRENVFVDSDKLAAGDDFRERLKREVTRSDICLALIGTNWLNLLHEKRDQPDDYVRLELESAMDAGIPVVPVLFGSARVPEKDELTPSIREVFSRHGVRLDITPGEFQSDISGLIEQINQCSPERDDIHDSARGALQRRDLGDPDLHRDPPGDRVVLRMESLTDASRGLREAFKNVDVEIFRGEIFAFTGAAGCGASMLVGALAGRKGYSAKGRVELIKPSGTIDALSEKGFSKEYLREVVMFGEGYRAGDLKKSVFDFLQKGGTLFSRHSISRVKEALTMAGYDDRFIRYRVNTLSMNERDGVILAAAVLRDPTIIFLDGVFEGRTPTGRAPLAASLVRLAKSGITIVLSSNDIANLGPWVDRVGWIDDHELRKVSAFQSL